jgi:hypothetical protein
MPAIQRGQVYKLGGGSWAYRYRDAAGRRRQVGGFNTKSEAAAVLDEQLRRMRLGGLYREEITLADLVERYLAQHQADPATLRKLSYDLRHGVRAFGDVRIDRLVPPRWRPGGPPSPRGPATAYPLAEASPSSGGRMADA